MSISTLALRSAQQQVAHSLRSIDRICRDENQHWWQVLRAVSHFEKTYRNYRLTLNEYRDIYSDSHWTALLVFTAMGHNDTAVGQTVRKLRRALHLVIGENITDHATAARLSAQLTDFNQFTFDSLSIEIELVSEMLDTLFTQEIRIPQRGK